MRKSIPHVSLYMASIFFWFIVLCTITFWSTPSQGEHIDTGIALRGHDSHHVVAQKNGKLLLNCSVITEQQHGPLEYLWKKDGKPLVLDSRIQIVQNGSLFFKKVLHRKKKNDEGIYECVATNKIGSIIARRVKLEVTGIARNYDKQPEPQTSVVGGVARFQCQIRATPPPLYTWMKDDIQQNANDRIIIISSGILQILDVREDDEGRYGCMTTPGGLHEYPDKVDSIRWKKSSEALLTVTSDTNTRDPILVAGPSNTTADIGQSVIFECLADGNPKPTVRWERGDGLPISDSFKLVGMNLKLLKVDWDDEGVYKCIIESPGHTTIIAKATLIIHSPPVIYEGPQSVALPPSMLNRFTCGVDGSPKPKVQWLKNGKMIDKQDAKYTIDKKKNQLIIRGSEEKDSGYYQCIVKNAAGYATAFAWYRVEMRDGAPEAPTGLTAWALSSTEAFLQWQPANAKPCCPILAYAWEIQETNNPSWVQSAVVQGENTSKHIKDLRPYTNYTLFVRAYSKLSGASIKSETVTLVTLEDVPEVAPLIRLASTTPSSILVEWDEIPEFGRNGVIIGYKIYYMKKGGTTIKVEVEHGQARSHLITGLDAETTYMVRVLAGTKEGYPSLQENQWPWMEYSTPSVGDMPRPPMMHVDVINDTAIRVLWQQTDTRYPVARYTLELKKLMEENSSRVVSMMPPTTFYDFGNLKNNTYYEISLTAHNEHGSSGSVTEEFITHPEPGPPVPRDLRVTLCTSRTMNLEWTQTQSNVVVLYYEARYHVYKADSTNPDYHVQKSNTTTVLIENLKPYTYYLFEVRALSRHGRGKFSNSIIERTREDVPSEPRNVRVKPQPQAIVIEWNPPAVTYGNITEYLVMYQSDNSPTWKTKSVNGSRTSVILENLMGGGYYIKLVACTAAGPGPSTEEQEVSLPGRSEGQEQQSPDQKLGIIVGVTIGIVCIIICILIIMLRNKCFSNSYPHTQPAHFHGNGHIPGHGNGAVRMGNGQDAHEMESYAPMLTVLPENHQFDSKGCGSGNLIVTPNGTRVNGYVPFRNGMRNGHVPNGHVTTFITSQDPQKSEETRGLLAAMLAASDGSYTSEEPGNKEGRSSQREPLDDIDKSADEKEADISPDGDALNDSDLPPPPPPPPASVGDIIDKGGGTTTKLYSDGVNHGELSQEFSPKDSAHSKENTGTDRNALPSVSIQNNSSCSNQHSTSTKPSRQSSDQVLHHPQGDTSHAHFNTSTSQPNNLISSTPTTGGLNQCHKAQGDIGHPIRGHNQQPQPPPYPGHRTVQGSPPLSNGRRRDLHHTTKTPQDILSGKSCSQGSRDIHV